MTNNNCVEGIGRPGSCSKNGAGSRPSIFEIWGRTSTPKDVPSTKSKSTIVHVIKDGGSELANINPIEGAVSSGSRSEGAAVDPLFSK